MALGGDLGRRPAPGRKDGAPSFAPAQAGRALVATRGLGSRRAASICWRAYTAAASMPKVARSATSSLVRWPRASCRAELKIGQLGDVMKLDSFRDIDRGVSWPPGTLEPFEQSGTLASVMISCGTLRRPVARPRGDRRRIRRSASGSLLYVWKPGAGAQRRQALEEADPGARYEGDALDRRVLVPVAYRI